MIQGAFLLHRLPRTQFLKLPRNYLTVRMPFLLSDLAGGEAFARIPTVVQSTQFVQAIDVVGGIASVLGFGLTIWVLIVAAGAKKAAEDARTLARRRNLVEELDEASHKLLEIGIFLHQQQWFGIQLRIDEVAAICRSAMTRWSDHLPEERRNDVLKAVQLIRSISAVSAELARREPSSAENKKLKTIHSRASELINDALGEARRNEERDGRNNGN
jgi:hypothetical protein